MKLKEITGTIQAVGPLLINAIKSGQLFHPQCELTEPDEDIMIDYDVKVPIVMCAHPYDNHLTPALRKHRSVVPLSNTA